MEVFSISSMNELLLEFEWFFYGQCSRPLVIEYEFRVSTLVVANFPKRNNMVYISSFKIR